LAPRDSHIPGSRKVLTMESLARGTEFLDAETGGLSVIKCIATVYGVA